MSYWGIVLSCRQGRSCSSCRLVWGSFQVWACSAGGSRGSSASHIVSAFGLPARTHYICLALGPTPLTTSNATAYLFDCTPQRLTGSHLPAQPVRISTQDSLLGLQLQMHSLSPLSTPQDSSSFCQAYSSPFHLPWATLSHGLPV